MNRRNLIKLGLASAAFAGSHIGVHAQQSADSPLMRVIPSTGERIPAVGLGSWITFNVGNDPVLLNSCTDVMAAFFRAGGKMIDSSPMYGSSQDTIGYGLEKLGRTDSVFSAEKVWTGDPAEGHEQIAQSRSEWGVASFDLMQVHNLVAWEAHLDRLQQRKANGDLRYVGITTSHGRRHGEFERIMVNHDLDFVQLTYNPVDREADERLLPLAREREIAVIVNRPFRGGPLVKDIAGTPLPGFASDLGVTSWAQLILKFILSHPAVTCAIPATTQPRHLVENMQAASDPLPDSAMREEIAGAILSA